MDAFDVASYLLPCSTGGRYFDDTERIELRLCGAWAREFKEELRKIIAARVADDASFRRVLGLVVFVDEDGEENMLIE